MDTFTRGQLARAASVGAEAIRYYEREGLLPANRSSNGYRYYTIDSLHRLRFIRRAKKLGFNLKEIKELLSLHDDPGAGRADVKSMTRDKLAEIEGRINDLRQIRAVLTRLEAGCSGEGPVQGCPIIHALDDPTLDRG